MQWTTIVCCAPRRQTTANVNTLASAANTGDVSHCHTCVRTAPCVSR